MSSERDTRIQNDMARAKAFAEQNPQWIQVDTREGEILLSIMRERPVADQGSWWWSDHHTVSIDFRYTYSDPAVPGLKVLPPILVHPNVHRYSGEISMSHRDKSVPIEDLIEHLWKLFALEAVDMDHVINPDSIEWYKQRLKTPLPVEESPEKQLQRRPAANVHEIRHMVQTESPGNVVAPPVQIRHMVQTESPDNAATPPVQIRHMVQIESPDNAATPPVQSGFQIKGIRRHKPIAGEFRQFYGQIDQKIPTTLNRWRYHIVQHSMETPATSPLKVVAHKRALQEIFDHARGDTRNERFGILVGGVYSDPETNQDWVEIVEFLEAERVNANSVRVEVSSDEISRLNARVDEVLRQTGETVRKIGWYHTHPGHGVFMSETDRENQRFCYTADWHIALVVDPINYEYGFFVGPACAPAHREKMIVVSEEQARRAQTPIYEASLSLRLGQERRRRREREQQEQAQKSLAASHQQFLPHPQTKANQREERPLLRLDNPPQVPQEQIYTPPMPQTPHIPENGSNAESGYVSTPLKPDSAATDQQEEDPSSTEATTPTSTRKKINLLKRQFPLPGKGFSSRQYIIIIINTLLIIFVLIGIVAWFSTNGQLVAQRQLSASQLQKAQSTNDQAVARIHQAQDSLLAPVPGLAAQQNARCVVQTILNAVVKLDAQSKDGLQAQSMLSNLPTTYNVQAGDTIATVAQQFGLTDQALLNANPTVQKRPHQKLLEGETISLPNC